MPGTGDMRKYMTDTTWVHYVMTPLILATLQVATVFVWSLNSHVQGHTCTCQPRQGQPGALFWNDEAVPRQSFIFAGVGFMVNS